MTLKANLNPVQYYLTCDAIVIGDPCPDKRLGVPVDPSTTAGARDSLFSEAASEGWSVGSSPQYKDYCPDHTAAMHGFTPGWHGRQGDAPQPGKTYIPPVIT